MLRTQPLSDSLSLSLVKMMDKAMLGKQRVNLAVMHVNVYEEYAMHMSVPICNA